MLAYIHFHARQLVGIKWYAHICADKDVKRIASNLDVLLLLRSLHLAQQEQLGLVSTFLDSLISRSRLQQLQLSATYINKELKARASSNPGCPHLLDCLLLPLAEHAVLRILAPPVLVPVDDGLELGFPLILCPSLRAAADQ